MSTCSWLIECRGHAIIFQKRNTFPFLKKLGICGLKSLFKIVIEIVIKTVIKIVIMIIIK